MSVSNFPDGFARGLTVRGMPVNIAHPGAVYFLNNTSVVAPNGIGGSDGNRGTYQQPFSTLAGSLLQCKAGRGDIIMVMPGHAETVSSATALTMNIQGVLVVGLGSGSLRPSFTLDTANTATINISAAQVGFVNCLFKANFAAIASCFTLTTAKDFTLRGCEFRDTSSILNFAKIVDTDATSNNADGLSIESCNWYGLGATANTALIKMDGTNDRVTVEDSYIAHAATTAAGLMPIAAGKVVTNLIVDNNKINLVGASGVTTGILITTDGTTNSGMISRNLVQSLDATSEILVTASSGFKYSQNYYSGTADTSGYLLPVADS